MHNELDNKVILDVFDKIQRLGEPHEDGRRLEGIVARSDFDGYSITLSGSGVSLQLNFHQSYHFDYASDRLKEQFMAKIDYIHRNFNG
ncbi:DUF3081 domain-containing protein [Zobellella taiwanensis]|jgi:hypothetical protein|uniref:DUF3081 domain-containing protein n=1 Tax=Zobellella taiwanensis TaxID=347535 RepID=A0A2P7R6K3_9GAMM|nr:DUF3081 domain-containing protein [Zobellella taiwanensis]PSJ45859.1 DUF3081 domain-containing protein [Zobellella taiwanensis]